MIEKTFALAQTESKIIEKVIMDENLHYMHMVLGQGDALPEHFSNGNVYMTVFRGRLSIQLGDQENHEYEKGTILKIPFNIKMNVRNLHPEVLEITVVKAPAPKG